MPEITLSAGRIHYRDSGSGPPILFVHGLLVNGSLWRKVTDRLESEFRCINPDWPMGAHRVPMAPSADLSPRGMARLVRGLLDALDLRDVTIVANDTGGVVTQLLLADGTERIARVVLTPCDSFDNFLPPLFRPLQLLSRIPGGLNVLLQSLRVRPLRRLPIAFGWLAKHPIPKELSDEWLHPCLTNKQIRRETARFINAMDSGDTIAVVDRLRGLDKPALLLWAREDRHFPFAHAKRWAQILPDARVVDVADSYTFVPLDQPDTVADQIAQFVARENVA